MQHELQLSIERYAKAYARLEEVFASDSNPELRRDAAIQRFEFTFELSWSTLKRFFAASGIECRSPKESFTKAFRQNLIDDEAVFLAMISDRNLTSHTYREDIAKDVFGRIQKIYLPLFEKLHVKLT